MRTSGTGTALRGLAVAFVLAMASGLPAPTEARADQAAEIAVGTRLEALADVTIAQAEIAKGSKVQVTNVVHREGRLSGVDVELADGYVARVTIHTIRASFRVASE